MPNAYNPDDLLGHMMSPAQGGRKPTLPLTFEVIRELTGEDDEVLLTADEEQAPLPTLVSIRNTHHQLARCIAEGHEMQTVSLITGYSPAYISRLKNDPAFAELLTYYATQAAQRHVDVVDRMKSFGLSTLDELQQRFEAAPEGFTKKELADLTRMMLIEGKVAPTTRAGASPVEGGGININVSFGQGGNKPPVIDLEAE